MEDRQWLQRGFILVEPRLHQAQKNGLLRSKDLNRLLKGCDAAGNEGHCGFFFYFTNFFDVHYYIFSFLIPLCYNFIRF